MLGLKFNYASKSGGVYMYYNPVMNKFGYMTH